MLDGSFQSFSFSMEDQQPILVLGTLTPNPKTKDHTNVSEDELFSFEEDDEQIVPSSSSSESFKNIPVISPHYGICYPPSQAPEKAIASVEKENIHVSYERATPFESIKQIRPPYKENSEILPKEGVSKKNKHTEEALVDDDSKLLQQAVALAQEAIENTQKQLQQALNVVLKKNHEQIILKEHYQKVLEQNQQLIKESSTYRQKALGCMQQRDVAISQCSQLMAANQKLVADLNAVQQELMREKNKNEALNNILSRNLQYLSLPTGLTQNPDAASIEVAKNCLPPAVKPNYPVATAEVSQPISHPTKSQGPMVTKNGRSESRSLLANFNRIQQSPAPKIGAEVPELRQKRYKFTAYTPPGGV